MKRNYLLIKSVYFTFALFTLIACKKEETKPADPIAPTPEPVVSKFSWKEDNGSEIVADSSFWTTGAWGTGIRAYKGGMTKFFEINWDTENNTSVGSKVLSTSNYGFTFLDGSNSYSISSDQTLTITENVSNKLSGNFTVSVTGGTITNIQGTFTAIEKK